MTPEIKRLKAKARRLYIRIHEAMADVDCGLDMLCYIRPSVGRDLVEFREVWDQLQKLDPDAPEGSPL